MNIFVIGGTGFIGSRVMELLSRAGHRQLVLHRGKTKSSLPANAQALVDERANLAAFKDDLKRFSPDVVLDMMAYTETDATGLVQAISGRVPRLVAISSVDVYRAYGLLKGIERDDAPASVGPADETAALRTKLYPYRELAKNETDRLYNYEKINVEGVYLSASSLSTTVMRLPMVHGPGDRQHRVFPYLKRMQDNRPAILLGDQQAGWRGTRGYVDNVATAIALVVTSDSARGIYNVGEPECFTEAEWVRQIATAANWRGEILVIPQSDLPRHLADDLHWQHHMNFSSTRLRLELGYLETVPRLEALRQTIQWELTNPPDFDEASFDYAAEDMLHRHHWDGSR